MGKGNSVAVQPDKKRLEFERLFLKGISRKVIQN